MEVASLERAYETIKEALISPVEARAIANEFLLRHTRDRFSAGQPALVLFPLAPVWVCPILFVYPERLLGEVGEVAVNAVTGEVTGRTPRQEIYRYADRLLDA
jgi:hypothetical protein